MGKFKYFKIGLGDASFLTYVIAAVVFLVIIYLLYLLFKITVVRHSKIRKEWKKFHNICEQKNLSSQEISFLEELIKNYKIPRPIYAVRSLEVFNRYIFREVLNHRGAETRKKENFLLFVTNLRKKLGFANFEFLDELTSSREIPEGTYTKTVVTIANIKKNFESKVVKVDEEGVTLSVPDHIMKEEPLRENLPVEFRFKLENDAEYKFNSKTYKIILGPPGYICIDHSRNFDRIQKRRYERIDTETPFKYFFLNPTQTKEFQETRKFALTKEIKHESGVIKNISGGGMYFDSDKDLEIGTLIAISFKLKEDAEEIKNIIGNVERIIDNEDDTYRIIIKFVKVKEPFRNQIIHYVYEKKIAMKKKKILSLKRLKRTTTA